MKILIIDNDSNRVRGLRTILSSLGYKAHDVEGSDDSEAALRSLKRKRYDMVVCAYSMPRLDGLSFLTKVRESSSIRNMPIVILETNPSRELIVEAGQAGADGFLVHPCSVDDVEVTMKNIQNKKKSR